MIDGRMFWQWLLTPVITIGGTQVTALQIGALIVIVTGSWWVAARIEVAIRRFGLHRSSSAAGIYAWARVVRYLIWVLATLIGLSAIGISLSSFALIGGALGVGIGFGLQNIFSNFFSGIILLLEKSLKEGDFVDLQSGIRGHVSEIGLRYTRITTNDDVDVIVPNTEFINGRVVNWTFGSEYRRMHVTFGVAYGSDKEAVKAAGLRAAGAVPSTIEDDRHRSDVWLVGLGDSSLDFELVVWVGLQATMAPGKTEAAYKWAIHDELVAAGLEIPFPQRDFNLRTGEVRVRIARDAKDAAADIGPESSPGITPTSASPSTPA